MEPRISTIEKPKGILSFLGFYSIKKQMGKVTTVAKVIYVRFPKIMMLVKKMLDIDKSQTIPEELQIMIRGYVATLNGCPFCIDTSKFYAYKKGFNVEKLSYLHNIEDSGIYTEKEKATLNYVKEVTKKVSVEDNTYAQLEKHWNEKEIIELTYLAASENFLNRLVTPLNIGSDNLCEIRNRN